MHDRCGVVLVGFAAGSGILRDTGLSARKYNLGLGFGKKNNIGTKNFCRN